MAVVEQRPGFVRTIDTETSGANEKKLLTSLKIDMSIVAEIRHPI